MRRAFTLLELLCAIAIIAILAALLLPVLEKGHGRAKRAACGSNLQNIGIAYSAWAHDHGGFYPMQVSTNQSGTREFAETAALNPNISFTFRHFQALSNDLAVPKVLRCPADRQRVPAEDFATLDNLHVSYWVNVGAGFGQTDSPLAGDRNVRTSGRMEWSYVQIASGDAAEFSAELHGHRGNVLFGDGHVSLYESAMLRAVFASTGGSNSGDTVLSLPRQRQNVELDASPNLSVVDSGTDAGAGSTKSADTSSSRNNSGADAGSREGAQTSNASASAAVPNSPASPRAGSSRRASASEQVPIVYTLLDGTVVTSTVPRQLTNALAVESAGHGETISPGNPLIEFVQWLARQAARNTYWLLLLLLAALITFEVARRRARRKRRRRVWD